MERALIVTSLELARRLNVKMDENAMWVRILQNSTQQNIGDNSDNWQ